MRTTYDPENVDGPDDVEAMWDEQEREREEAEWLASWSDDFHSDEWADALAPTSADEWAA
jgi:hypothetical protein